MTVRRVFAVVGLLIGLAIAAILWAVWLDLTLKLREGLGLRIRFALVPPAVVLIGFIAVIVALVQLFRHRQQGLTTVNIVVWTSNAISYLMLLFFGVR